ncbi:MAG: hypothetical protein AB7U82_15350 [Blastocatellales bacterium]
MNCKSGMSAHLWFPLFCVSLAVLCSQSINAQGKPVSKSSKEVYRGNITLIGGPRGAGVEFFTLTIESFTPDNRVQNLLDILKRGGQDDLLKAIGKDKRGTIQIGNGISRDLNEIWMAPTEEGRKITALSERWVGFGELRRGARSLDYPFTYLELYVEDDGKAEGGLIPAARIRFKSGKTIEVENFGIYPARLTNVKRRRK